MAMKSYAADPGKVKANTRMVGKPAGSSKMGPKMPNLRKGNKFQKAGGK